MDHVIILGIEHKFILDVNVFSEEKEYVVKLNVNRGKEELHAWVTWRVLR